VLDAWRPAQSAGPNFAERVVAEHLASRHRGRWLGVIGLVAAAAVALVVIGPPRPQARGQLLAHGRTTVPLGDRGIAVAEDGSEISWDSIQGSLRVDETHGDVFYRVEPTGAWTGSEAFLVRTPAGEVRVLGTCFRVEVMEGTGVDAKRAGAIGALVGATAATAVITVYEGRVTTASAGGPAAIVEAGQVARLESGRAPSISDPSAPRRAPGVAVGAHALGGADSAHETAQADVLLPTGHPTVAKLEADQLRARVEELERELEKEKKSRTPIKTYDLDQDTLAEMAKKCELRWDLPTLGSTPQTINSEDASKLGLDSNAKAAINRLMADRNAALLASVRKVYSELTGDENTAALSPEAMISEIEDKAPRATLQLAFQRLAQERAGQPAAGPGSPVEALFRLLTAEGDHFQQDLAKQIGPDEAQAYRDLHSGFGSRHRSSYGCPGSE
jgi:hypothetical protein